MSLLAHSGRSIAGAGHIQSEADSSPDLPAIWYFVRGPRQLTPRRQMAIQVLSLTPARLAVAVLSAAIFTMMCALHAVADAAAPVPDGVSLSESTIAWSTVRYATSAENGLFDGSLDEK